MKNKGINAKEFRDVLNVLGLSYESALCRIMSSYTQLYKEYDDKDDLRKSAYIYDTLKESGYFDYLEKQFESMEKIKEDE